MKNDRQVHELSYLYANSLYEIRARSESLMSSCRMFLKTDRNRIDWVAKLEQYHDAFDICDSSGDGSIERSELENMLARFTADGGTLHGHKCTCKICSSWRDVVQVTEVDWDRFGEKFDAIDDDSSGSLEFRACAMHGSPLAFASEPVLTVGLPTARAVWARLRR
jgi:hypothetical protein